MRAGYATVVGCMSFVGFVYVRKASVIVRLAHSDQEDCDMPEITGLFGDKNIYNHNVISAIQVPSIKHNTYTQHICTVAVIPSLTMPLFAQTGKPRVILGLMTFGPDPSAGARITSLEEYNKCLDYFQSQGYNEVDTARSYIGGKSIREHKFIFC